MAPVGRVIGQSCADSDLAVRKTTTLAFRRISMRDRMLFLAMAAVSWIALGEPALAQQVSDTVAPGAVERSLERRLPQVGEDRVNIPPPQGFEAPPGAGDIRFVLRRVELAGATAIPEHDLARAYASLIGKDVSLADVFRAARAITDLYASAGYALSFAVVPAQAVDKASGVVRVEVVEGYVAEVSFTGPAPAAARAYAARLRRSRPLRTADLERYLLLMDDLPGVTARSVFKRLENAPAGATGLVIQAVPRPLSASADLHNRGSSAFGPWRTDGMLGLNSPLGLGEGLELRAVRALDGNELTYLAGKATVPIGGDGLSLALNLAHTDARPGTPLLAQAAFQSSGWTASAALTYPVRRSRAQSLWLWSGVSIKRLHSEIVATPNSQDRLFLLQAGSTWTGRDATGATAADLTLSQGLAAFDATTATSPLRSRSAGSGQFTSLSADITRLQRLGGGFDLFLAGSGQIASRGLLSPERCGFGGAAFGRGFDDSEIAGDSCLMGSAELRFTPLARPPAGAGTLSQLQLFTVFDAGMVRRLGALQPREHRGAGARSAGLGARVNLGSAVDASLEWDKPIGRDVALEGSRAGRVFLRLEARY